MGSAIVGGGLGLHFRDGAKTGDIVSAMWQRAGEMEPGMMRVVWRVRHVIRELGAYVFMRALTYDWKTAAYYATISIQHGPVSRKQAAAIHNATLTILQEQGANDGSPAKVYKVTVGGKVVLNSDIVDVGSLQILMLQQMQSSGSRDAAVDVNRLAAGHKKTANELKSAGFIHYASTYAGSLERKIDGLEKSLTAAQAASDVAGFEKAKALAASLSVDISGRSNTSEVIAAIDAHLQALNEQSEEARGELIGIANAGGASLSDTAAPQEAIGAIKRQIEATVARHREDLSRLTGEATAAQEALANAAGDAGKAKLAEVAQSIGAVVDPDQATLKSNIQAKVEELKAAAAEIERAQAAMKHQTVELVNAANRIGCQMAGHSAAHADVLARIEARFDAINEEHAQKIAKVKAEIESAIREAYTAKLTELVDPIRELRALAGMEDDHDPIRLDGPSMARTLSEIVTAIRNKESVASATFDAERAKLAEAHKVALTTLNGILPEEKRVGSFRGALAAVDEQMRALQAAGEDIIAMAKPIGDLGDEARAADYIQPLAKYLEKQKAEVARLGVRLAEASGSADVAVWRQVASELGVEDVESKDIQALQPAVKTRIGEIKAEAEAPMKSIHERLSQLAGHLGVAGMPEDTSGLLGVLGDSINGIVEAHQHRIFTLLESVVSRTGIDIGGEAKLEAVLQRLADVFADEGDHANAKNAEIVAQMQEALGKDPIDINGQIFAGALALHDTMQARASGDAHEVADLEAKLTEARKEAGIQKQALALMQGQIDGHEEAIAKAVAEAVAHTIRIVAQSGSITGEHSLDERIEAVNGVAAKFSSGLKVQRIEGGHIQVLAS